MASQILNVGTKGTDRTAKSQQPTKLDPLETNHRTAGRNTTNLGTSSGSAAALLSMKQRLIAAVLTFLGHQIAGSTHQSTPQVLGKRMVHYHFDPRRFPCLAPNCELQQVKTQVFFLFLQWQRSKSDDFPQIPVRRLVNPTQEKGNSGSFRSLRNYLERAYFLVLRETYKTS